MNTNKTADKFGKMAIQLLVVIGCSAYAFSGINYAELINRFQNIDFFLFIPAVMTIFLGYLFLALRLLSLLKTYDWSTFKKSLNASILALGVNNIFPLKLGEIAKVVYINKKIDTPLPTSLSLVIWERFADVNLLALLGLLIMAFYQPDINLTPFLVAVLILWIGLFIYLKVDFIFRRLTFFLPQFIHGLLNKLHAALTESRSVGNISLIILLTLMVWFAYTFQLWFILEKLLLIELSLAQLLTVFVISAIGMAVPSVPGALGVYEAAMVLSLGWFGIDKTEALLAGIVCHAFIIIPCTLISLFIIANLSFSMSDFNAALLKMKNQMSKR